MKSLHLKKEAEVQHLVENMQDYRIRPFVDIRGDYIKAYGFTFLSHEFLFSLKDFIGERTLIDLMCGSGYISYALSQHGIKTIQVDDKSWKSDHWWEENNRKHHDLIVSNSVRYLRDNHPTKETVILVSWPYMNKTMWAIGRELRKQNFQGDLLYVGESWGGCTADLRFFNTFSLEELPFQPLQWYGMHDCISKVDILGKKPEVGHHMW